MTTPAAELRTDLNNHAERIVGAFYPEPPLRPNDHLSSFFHQLLGSRSHSRSQYTREGLILECTFLKTSWGAWFAFVSMRRRKSRSGEGKAGYKALCEEIERLSPESQQYLAYRVATHLSEPLRDAANQAWNDKPLKWKAECQKIINSNRTVEDIIKSFRGSVSSEPTGVISTATTPILADGDVVMDTALDNESTNLAQAHGLSGRESPLRIMSPALGIRRFEAPWDRTMPPWLRYHLQRKKLKDQTVYMGRPEWDSTNQEPFGRQLFQATKLRSDTPGHRDITISALSPSEHIDWATICFNLERSSLQAFAAGLFARIIKEDQGTLMAVSPDGRENTPSEFDCLQCCSRSPQDLRLWLGDILFAAVKALSTWKSEEASGDLFTKCVSLQWHSDPAMDSYLIVDISNTHLDKFVSPASLFHMKL